MSVFFHRPTLAKKMANVILASGTINAASSGLFVAAPRRTGKSTFMREDLRPLLQSQQVLVLYADLWANKQNDPGEVILAAIRQELLSHEGVITKLARASGMDKVGVAGMTFSIDKVGLGKEISLSQALAALSDETRKMIVLIVDEAQHAITTDNGANALFALKAARDELNSSKHHGLRIIATGSNRNKLVMLRNSREQAFFGAPVMDLPCLDSYYTDWFCEHVDLPVSLDPNEVFDWFKKASFRPEILATAADSVRMDMTLQDNDVQARFAEEVAKEIQSHRLESLKLIRSLTSIQSAVFRVLVASGETYAPFEVSTIARYNNAIKLIDPQSTAEIEVSNVQQALTALQDKNLVWKASRGIYDLEDYAIKELMDEEGMLQHV